MIHFCILLFLISGELLKWFCYGLHQMEMKVLNHATEWFSFLPHLTPRMKCLLIPQLMYLRVCLHCFFVVSVSKTQHGCIDCLALMICAKLQAPESFKECTSWRSNIVGKKGESGWYFVLDMNCYVIQCRRYHLFWLIL